MSSPLVSVVIPCYNQGEFLAEAIESVLAQSYANWQCIVVDDGSTDHTAAVIDKYLSTDERIKAIRKKNGGLSSARNDGIALAHGEFILPLDADDKIGSEYLSRAVDILKKDTKIKILYSEVEFFGSASGRRVVSDYSLKLLATTNMIVCSAFFKRDDWARIGGYDPEMKYGLEDWEFWIHLMKSGDGSVYKLDYVGFYYRIKENSMFKSMRKEHMEYSENYISKKHADFIYSMIGNPIELNRKLNYYETRINRIESTAGYKIVKRVKNFFLNR